MCIRDRHPNSRQYVAFIFEGRNYHFKRLPFGLVNSVAMFIQCMDQILGKEVLDFTTIYVDDINYVLYMGGTL